jgi:hypothetical protein
MVAVRGPKQCHWAESNMLGAASSLAVTSICIFSADDIMGGVFVQQG